MNEDEGNALLISPLGLPSDLLLALYHGPLDTPLWSSFLEKLRQFLRVDYSSLVFRKFDAPVEQSLAFTSTDMPRGPRGIDIVDRLYSASKFPYEELPGGKPFLVEDILDKGNEFHTAYVSEFLQPRGHNQMMVMKVIEPGGSFAVLNVSRRDRGMDVTSTKACFRELAPHLAKALQYFAVLEKEYYRSGILSAAFHRLNFGSITLDASGEIIDLDEHARKLLQSAGVLLKGPRGNNRIDLRRSSPQVREAYHASLSPLTAKTRVIQLMDDPRTDMLVVPVVERPVTGDRTPVAIGYVHGDKVLDPAQGERIAELFGLSRSETALTLAICNGRTIGEAAAEQGITVETARTYSKRIYSKTGTRGQADLIRLILASVIIVA